MVFARYSTIKQNIVLHDLARLSIRDQARLCKIKQDQKRSCNMFHPLFQNFEYKTIFHPVNGVGEGGPQNGNETM